MAYDKIPAELEPLIEELVKQKKDQQYVVAWLEKEYGLRPSVMAVHRIVERYRELHQTHTVEEEIEEARAKVGSHLRKMKSVADQMEQMAIQVRDGDAAAGIPPNPVAAEKLFRQHERFFLTWIRLVEQEIRRLTPTPASRTRRRPAQNTEQVASPQPQPEPDPVPANRTLH